MTEDELKKHVKENLAGYKVPQEIEFIDELPRNAPARCSSASWRSGSTARADGPALAQG